MKSDGVADKEKEAVGVVDEDAVGVRVADSRAERGGEGVKVGVQVKAKAGDNVGVEVACPADDAEEVEMRLPIGLVVGCGVAEGEGDEVGVGDVEPERESKAL